jgi:FkbM family methyltransferase
MRIQQFLYEELRNWALSGSGTRTPIKRCLHASLWLKRHLMGQYKIDELRFIARFVQPDDVLLDVGAHAGSWTRPLSKLVGRGHVYAFEALPYYAEVLKLTAKLLNLKNVTVLNRAVTDHNGRLKLTWQDTRGKHLSGLTHIAGVSEDTRNAICVDGITLDAFIASHRVRSRVAFVKVDVEGAELMVVHGAEKTIEQFRPVFYLEIVATYCQRYGYQPVDVFDFFSTRQYCAYTINHGKQSETNKKTYAGHDVLFVPHEYVSSYSRDASYENWN